jgi:hypothetical protein
VAGETPALSADGHRRLVAPRGDWTPPSR